MYGSRNYYNRMSQLQNPGQSFAMHQSCHGCRMHHRGPRGHKMNHGGHFVSLMQGCHNKNLANSYNADSEFYQQASSITLPGYHRQVNHNNPHPHYNKFNNNKHPNYKQFNNDKHPYYKEFNNSNNECLYYKQFDNDIPVHGRAIQGVSVVEDSLFPYGDSMPEDYLNNWDQKPECPRIKWEIPPNPSWKPAFIPHNRDYTGTELILARELETERATRSGYFDNLRTNSSRTSETTSRGSAFSDSSSIKSGSSSDSY